MLIEFLLLTMELKKSVLLTPVAVDYLKERNLETK